MQHPWFRRASLASLLLGAAAACGPGPRPAADAGPDSPDAEPDIDASIEPDGNFLLDSTVYAHGNGNLYSINTDTFEPELIAAITGLDTSSLTDLAVDKDGNAVGITLSKLFSIDLETGAATLLRDNIGDDQGDGFTSLSYVPLDLNDPTSAERLVAANVDGNVFEIDPLTGDSTLLGNYGGSGPTQIRSSGDIVAIRGLGVFASVTIGDDLADPDYFAEINPTTWAATTVGAGTGFDRIFGLGYWGGTFFGFVDGGPDAGTGRIVEIDATTGVATSRDLGDVRWYGAGVTTNAPIID